MAEKLVKMKRGEPATTGGPTTADVHSEEVESYLNAGWEIDNAPAKRTASAEEVSEIEEVPVKKRK